MDADGNELPLVTISVKGSKTNVTTNYLGEFSIMAKTSEVLKVSARGHISKEVVVTKESVYNIVLEKDSNTEKRMGSAMHKDSAAVPRARKH